MTKLDQLEAGIKAEFDRQVSGSAKLVPIDFAKLARAAMVADGLGIYEYRPIVETIWQVMIGAALEEKP